MKLLGRVQLNEGQSRDLASGGTIDMPAEQFREYCSPLARIGDLAWVQEPFSHYVQKRGRREEAFVPGPVGAAWLNKNPKFGSFLDSQFSRGHARYLRRIHSRAPLEVMGFADSSVRCLVHMQQVDAFVKERRSAA